MPLAPEVLLYVLGRDAAAYSPGLRVYASSDRRWRARWAESMGESVAALFLERAVDIDLSTLARIPERADRETPDFLACTRSDRQVVFEAKGATDWRTHRSQRKKALAQVGKGGGDDKASASWDTSGGQAFACSLFAAEHGSDESSLFHAADPAFAFGDLFHEGWEDWARRQHYAGILQAARLHGAADMVLRRRQAEPSEGREPEPFRLSFAPEGEAQASLFGSTTDLQEMARALGHPDPTAYRGAKLFVGIDSLLFRYLAEGDLPPRTPAAMGEGEAERGRLPRSPLAGMLPSDAEGGRGGGVYSVLPDGSFLAVTVPA